MTELLKDMGGALLTGEKGSRKAQAFLVGLGVAAAKPEIAWQAISLTGLYILGRAIHDTALARAGQ